MFISRRTRRAAAVLGLVVGGFSVPSFAAYSTSVLADNPLAYYPLNEIAASTSASDIAPALGANNAAQDGGTVTFGSTGLVADSGNSSATFSDASGQNGRLITGGFDKINTGYTVEYWIRISAMPLAGSTCCAPLVGDGEGGGDFYNMNYLIGPAQGATGAIRAHYSVENSPVGNDSIGVLATDTTYHVVTTYDQTTDTANIYFNGVLNKSITVTGDSLNSTYTDNPLFLGRDNREGYNGATFTLDEVAVYDYALSASRVAAHYQAGTVPEPASLALLGLGAIGLFARRQKV